MKREIGFAVGDGPALEVFSTASTALLLGLSLVVALLSVAGAARAGVYSASADASTEVTASQRRASASATPAVSAKPGATDARADASPTPVTTSNGGGASPGSGVPAQIVEYDESLTEQIIADIETNPAYSAETRAILIEQIASDFSIFDQLGRTQTPAAGIRFETAGARPSTGALAPVSPLVIERIGLFDSMTGVYQSHECSGSGPCEFPEEYNISHDRVWITWGFRSAQAALDWQRFDDQTGNAELRVLINGGALDGAGAHTYAAALAGNGFGPRDYYTFRAPGSCGPGGTLPCLTTVFLRHAWFSTPPPWSDWTIELEGWDLEALESHKIAFDRFGNPVVVRAEYRKIVSARGVVSPKPVLKDYFTATIGETTLSGTCTTCHSLTTPQKIAEQHGTASMNVVQIPSALVPNATINGCESCHYAGLLPSFNERRWATPPASMDIDWAAIVGAHPQTWAVEICNRMVSNMPTAAIRREHFHEDARLFWAVTSGEVPGGYTRPTAPPNDYGLFIDRFDRWNDAGARCPQ